MPESLLTVHISTPRTLRGGEYQALLLIRGLVARGHRVVLAAPPGSALASRAVAAGVRVWELAVRAEFDPFAIARLALALRSICPDTVHCHDSHAVTIGGAAARAARVSARLASRRVDYPLRRRWKWRHMVHRIIAVSEFVRNRLIAEGIPADTVDVVRSAVDPERLAGGDGARVRAELGVPADRRILLCPAAFTEQKGHEFLIDALAGVARNRPNVTLLLAGEGPLEAATRQRAAARGLGPEFVRFLGWRNDVADLYAAADLFVMASRYEGLCTAALDALWAGVPVVVSAAGGLPEAVGNAGRLVPVGDVEALGCAITTALDDRAESSRLAALGRQRIDRLFSADALVEATLAAYSRALRSPRLRLTPGRARQQRPRDPREITC